MTRLPDYPDSRDLKAVREGRPYPDHDLTLKQWAEFPSHALRLDQLITTKSELGLDRLLAGDSTFYGELFPLVVQWKGDLYLEDGSPRALIPRSPQQRWPARSSTAELMTSKPLHPTLVPALVDAVLSPR